MGKILLYGAGRACQAYSCEPTVQGEGYAVHPYKTIDGTSSSAVYWYTYSTTNYNYIMNNMKFYTGLTSYASADTESDFSLDHYTTREISGLSYSRSTSTQTAGRIYTCQVTNNNAEDITVGSIKFTKDVYYQSSGSSKKNCLILGYFFDSPVTIPAGGVKTFVVNFDC